MNPTPPGAAPVKLTVAMISRNEEGAVGGVVDAIRAAVPDAEILEASYLLGRTTGIWPAPEGGATLAAFLWLRKEGWIREGESVVLFNTGNGAKYSHIWD